MGYKKRFFGALLSLGLMATMTGLGVLAPQAARASGGVEVFVGYADTLRANPAHFPTPWEGSPGVVYQGCSPSTGPSACSFDAGAVRFVNNTGAPVSITGITVNVSTCSYHGWAGATSLPAGKQLIVTQLMSGAASGCTGPTPDSMDTSDIGPNGVSYASNCHPDGIKPTVDATIDGSPQTFTDSGQVLNTGGFDLAACPAGTNESTQWSPVGESCPSSSLTLAPPSQTDPIGSTATVTATFKDSCGHPLQGAVIDFSALSGPNAGTSGMGTTDSGGHASFSYTSTKPGTDTLQASTTNPAGTITSNDVTVTWVGAFLARGSFVIADTSAVMGQHVTFWGAQWAKRNVPSGGPAPSAFKGFASTTQSSPPTCGQTWLSRPGNSARPPKGPLPAFMAVIVSSSVTKAGHTISGNVVEIVTVKVSPGYANNPGHRGTGIVVGKIC
jgi:Bacterial Ig-like domain (group 1)